MCQGESGVLCFVLLAYYTTHFPACQVFFKFFSKNIFSTVSSFWCDMFVHGKTNKKCEPNRVYFLHRMFFHKKIRLFSSQLNIYKSAQMRYNIYAVGNRRQVPFVAHCKARFCEMSILWHHYAQRHDRCAILMPFFGATEVSCFPLLCFFAFYLFK